MTRQAINPDELFNSVQYGFSQITIGTGSRIITLSGQVGWDENENIVDKDSLAKQTVKAFENLDAAMKAAGGSLDNVLSLRIYIVERAKSQNKAIGDALRQFFPTNPPTTTWIGVTSLSREDFLVEIEAFGVLS